MSPTINFKLILWFFWFISKQYFHRNGSYLSLSLSSSGWPVSFQPPKKHLCAFILFCSGTSWSHPFDLSAEYFKWWKALFNDCVWCVVLKLKEKNIMNREGTSLYMKLLHYYTSVFIAQKRNNTHSHTYAAGIWLS